jgi:hypothetical protein
MGNANCQVGDVALAKVDRADRFNDRDAEGQARGTIILVHVV